MKRNHGSVRPPAWMGAAIACLLTLNVLLGLAQTKDSPPSKHRTWEYTGLTKIPAKARERLNPLESDPDAVAAGKKLFVQHCSECHGKDASGGKRGPDLHADVMQKATPGEIFFVITNGVIRHGMPGWANLPEPERWQIVSYLATSHKVQP